MANFQPASGCLCYTAVSLTSNWSPAGYLKKTITVKKTRSRPRKKNFLFSYFPVFFHKFPPQSCLYTVTTAVHQLQFLRNYKRIYWHILWLKWSVYLHVFQQTHKGLENWHLFILWYCHHSTFPLFPRNSPALMRFVEAIWTNYAIWIGYIYFIIIHIWCHMCDGPKELGT